MDNTKMLPGDFVNSPNNRYSLVFQADDRNLAFYKNSESGDSREPVWDADIAGKGATEVRFQDDGNLVAYDKDGKCLWASDTADYHDNPQSYTGWSNYTTFNGGCKSYQTMQNEVEATHQWKGVFFVIYDTGVWGMVCKDVLAGREEYPLSDPINNRDRHGGPFSNQTYWKSADGRVSLAMICLGVLAFGEICFAFGSAVSGAAAGEATVDATVVSSEAELNEAFKLLRDIPGDNDIMYKRFLFKVKTFNL